MSQEQNTKEVELLEPQSTAQSLLEYLFKDDENANEQVAQYMDGFTADMQDIAQALNDTENEVVVSAHYYEYVVIVGRIKHDQTAEPAYMTRLNIVESRGTENVFVHAAQTGCVFPFFMFMGDIAIAVTSLEDVDFNDVTVDEDKISD